MPSWGTITISPKVHAVEGEARRMLNESTGLPEILFLIPAQDFSLIINEVSNIMQLMLAGLSIRMCFHYCPRCYAYPKLFCQLLISLQIIVPLPAEGEELSIFGHPVCEMIFGKNSEVGAF